MGIPACTVQAAELIAPELGQKVLFCTPTGGGSGISWTSPCTFRQAVALAGTTVVTTIFLGAGLHDTNNGSDNTGTTISTNYVRLVGFGEDGEIGQDSQLMNSKSGATNILIVTGSQFVCTNVAFDNSAQTTKSLTAHLTLSGSYSTVRDCVFRQTVADGANTGVLCNNSGVSFTIERCRFRRLEGVGVNFGSAQRFYFNDNVFWKCATGLYASSANADGGVLRGNTYMGNTTAWNIDTAVAKEWYSTDATFENNTTNCAAFSAYSGTIKIANARTAAVAAQLFPAAAGGVSIEKTAAAWTQGAYVNFMTENTITKPFIITQVNVQGNNAAQTYRLEIFYGVDLANATTSVGNFEIQVSSSAIPSIPMNMYIPARAALRCKLASSTANTDDITISIQYKTL